jgi:neutral ceramidase
MSEQFLAGFGRREITPRRPCFLVGYPHVERTSTGVHDPLFASVVCLQNESTAVLLISLDILFVSAEWTRDCRECIHRETGIPAESILIAATHTHSGPHVAEVLAWKDDPVVPPVDPHYLAFMREQTLAAAVDAWKTLEPARAAWTTADARSLAGGNRIDPTGAEDPEAGLLILRHASTRAPLAVLSIYGMHPTVLHEDSTLVSSDFIGFARAEVEAALPGAGMVYLNGVCGNQSPRRVVTAQTFAEAERIGRALGKRMLEALSLAEDFTENFPVCGSIRTLRLEGKIFPPVEEAAANLERARSEFARLKSEGAPASAVRTAECTVFGAEEVLTLAHAELTGEAGGLREKYRHMEIQAFRLGDTILAAWPGEFFVEYGLEFKRRAGTRAFVVTMANGDLQGYVVTPEAEAAQGYEAQMSLFPARVGSQFVEETLALREKLI